MAAESSSSKSDVKSNCSGDDVHVSVTMNTLLAYAQYCISCATSDNTRHVLCSHFSAEEISEAKDVLWEKLELPEQKRTNSSKRPASESDVGDIMAALYKIDISTDNHVFYVDSMGIGRLPRFNPENLNVVAIDHRIAELVDHCRVLQGQVDSYRTLAMRCTDRLDVYDTVLQQHSNLLREIKYQQSPYLPTAPNTVRNVDRNVDRNIDRNVDRNVDRNIDRNVDQNVDRNIDRNVDRNVDRNIDRIFDSNVGSSAGRNGGSNAGRNVGSNVGSNGCSNVGSKGGSNVGSNVDRNVDSNVGSNIDRDVTGEAKKIEKQAPEHSTSNILIKKKLSTSLPDLSSHQLNQNPLFSSKVSINSGLKSFWNQMTPFQNNGESGNSNNSVRKIDVHEDQSEFCAFSNHQENDNITKDDFQQNPLDKRRSRQRENRRTKVVKGSANILGSRFVGGTKGSRMCDIFVHHVAKQSTLKDLKYYLNHNGFDTDRMRIDITSNKEATYKSFRIIASGDLRKSLLDSELWPVGVWVRDYDLVRPNRLRNGPSNHGREYNHQNGY